MKSCVQCVDSSRIACIHNEYGNSGRAAGSPKGEDSGQTAVASCHRRHPRQRMGMASLKSTLSGSKTLPGQTRLAEKQPIGASGRPSALLSIVNAVKISPQGSKPFQPSHRRELNECSSRIPRRASRPGLWPNSERVRLEVLIDVPKNSGPGGMRLGKRLVPMRPVTNAKCGSRINDIPADTSRNAAQILKTRNHRTLAGFVHHLIRETRPTPPTLPCEGSYVHAGTATGQFPWRSPSREGTA